MDLEIGRIRKMLSVNPDKIILYFYCFATHGMNMSGRQVILLNDYSKNTGFYKLAAVEIEIRNIAKKHENSYQICLCACCREVLIRDKHSGGFSKAEAEKIVENSRNQFRKESGAYINKIIDIAIKTGD